MVPTDIWSHGKAGTSVCILQKLHKCFIISRHDVWMGATAIPTMHCTNRRIDHFKTHLHAQGYTPFFHER
jgi:hypothetical protein